MIMVVQSYIEENFIKKNSTNPNKAKKLIVSTDEAHRILKFEGARMFENALYLSLIHISEPTRPY